MKEKIIFLDIDGCLNHRDYYQRVPLSERRPYPLSEFDTISVEYLNHLTSITGASIVVSSSWRFDSNLDNIFKEAGIKIPISGRTPCLPKRIRGEEIEAYLQVHHTDNYVIIDDDRDFLHKQRKHHVWCNAEEDGFNEKCMNKAIRILNG